MNTIAFDQAVIIAAITYSLGCMCGFLLRWLWDRDQQPTRRR